MALIVSDRVQETSTTTGTGAFTLLGAITGYRAASAVCTTGDTFTYYAEDIDANGGPTGAWETGLGTWSTGNILTRTTVYASSNANAAVSWAAGTRRIGLGLVSNAALGPTTIVGNISATNLSGTNTGDNAVNSLYAGQNVKNFTVTVPTAVNDAINIATVTNTNFSSNVELWLTIHSSGYAQSKRYIVPVQYNGTAGAWQKALPISSTGPYSGNNAEIDVMVLNQTATFRVRRTSGATAGTASITLAIGGDPVNTTVTADSTTFASQTVSVNYLPTSLTMINGNTGINNDNPSEKLNVAGNILATGTILGSNLSGTNTGDQSASAILDAIKTVDGTGSGLDADLLDGYNSSTTDVASTVVVRDTNKFVGISGINLSTNDLDAPATVQMKWNVIDSTWDFQLKNGVTLQAGQELHFYGRATEAIANGDVVMFAGTQGDGILIAKANAAAIGFHPSWVVGIATQNIAINDWGYVTWFGKVNDVDTFGLTLGDILYLDPAVAGGLTVTLPVAPNPKIRIASVVRVASAVNSNNGILMVRPHYAEKLSELQDVSITSIANGDLIAWDSTNSRWQNQARNNVVSVSASVYNATAVSGSTIILCNTASNNITVNLPTAVNNKAVYEIKKTAAANSMILDPLSTETIDGSTTITVVVENESLTLVSDNTNWKVI